MPPREADFRRIAREIADAIAAGEYAPGDPLPRIDDIAADYAVHRSTVQRALYILDDRGLVEGRQGRRVFVRLQKATDGGAPTVAPSAE